MLYFVYKTTNLINNKTYIGIHKTNNIDDGYLGSGLHFLKAVKKYGKQNFKREILEFCLSYEELLEKEKSYVTEEWVKNGDNYNLKTGGQSSGLLSEISKQKISETLKTKYANGELKPRLTAPYIATDEQKEKISKTLKTKYANGELKPTMTGIEPWNKGKKGLQIPWNKGKKLNSLSDEIKKKISETLKNKHNKGEIKTRKGKEPWNKGKTGLQKAWNKGIKLEKIMCPYCNKMVDPLNGKRWHFENCKNKK